MVERAQSSTSWQFGPPKRLPQIKKKNPSQRAPANHARKAPCPVLSTIVSGTEHLSPFWFLYTTALIGGLCHDPKPSLSHLFLGAWEILGAESGGFGQHDEANTDGCPGGFLGLNTSKSK